MKSLIFKVKVKITGAAGKHDERTIRGIGKTGKSDERGQILSQKGIFR